MPRRKSEMAQLLNLGPVSEEWLNAIGVYTQSDLNRLGPVATFLQVKRAGFNPSLNLLYALAGAAAGVRWNKLPKDMKTRLLLELDAMEDGNRLTGRAR
jgi:DNA transformation protein and related proteins